MAEECLAVKRLSLGVAQPHAGADVGVLDLEGHLVQAGLRQRKIGLPVAGLLPRRQLDPAVGQSELRTISSDGFSLVHGQFRRTVES